MVETVSPSIRPSVDALVALVSGAVAEGDELLSTNRMVDALLDARSEVSGIAVDAVDAALVACAHRQILPVSEAVELVAAITSA
jgi:hypothetical protein